MSMTHSQGGARSQHTLVHNPCDAAKERDVVLEMDVQQSYEGVQCQVVDQDWPLCACCKLSCLHTGKAGLLLGRCSCTSHAPSAGPHGSYVERKWSCQGLKQRTQWSACSQMNSRQCCVGTNENCKLRLRGQCLQIAHNLHYGASGLSTPMHLSWSPTHLDARRASAAHAAPAAATQGHAATFWLHQHAA